MRTITFCFAFSFSFPLEYVPGGPLKDLIHNTDLVLPWELRIRFAKDIACGMNYLHSQNIIHRDLNSLNCLVREDKTVIVADFGLARIIKSGNCKSSNRLTVDGIGTVNRKYRQRRQRYTVVGNPYWMGNNYTSIRHYISFLKYKNLIYFSFCFLIFFYLN